MLLGMVRELITDQKCLLSLAKVFIDSPSSTKWGGGQGRMCEDGWEIAVCFFILDSPLRPFLSVLVFTILINVAQMEDISPLPQKGRHQRASFALAKFIPCLWRSLESAPSTLLHSLTHLVIHSTTIPTMLYNYGGYKSEEDWTLSSSCSKSNGENKIYIQIILIQDRG